MLSNTTTIAFGNIATAAGGVSANHYFHVSAPAQIVSLAAILNGTTINSAADVVITFTRLRGVAGTLALGTINLPNATVAGEGVSGSIAAVELLPGDRVQADVTTLATVAGGSATLTIGLQYG